MTVNISGDPTHTVTHSHSPAHSLTLIRSCQGTTVVTAMTAQGYIPAAWPDSAPVPWHDTHISTLNQPWLGLIYFPHFQLISVDLGNYWHNSTIETKTTKHWLSPSKSSRTHKSEILQDSTLHHRDDVGRLPISLLLFSRSIKWA